MFSYQSNYFYVFSRVDIMRKGVSMHRPHTALSMETIEHGELFGS